MESKQLGVNVVFFVGVRIQTLELIPVLVAPLAKEKVIAVLAHPAPFVYQLLAVKAFVFLLLVKLRLEHSLELMIHPVRLGAI